MDRENHDNLRISLDGEAIEARPGDTVAAALLRSGRTTFTRSIKYHRPRGPFCLSGSCGQCLMRIDGVPSRPACRVPAEEGMICERQNGPLGVEQDLFRAADFVFADGLDHHHLLTGSRVLGRVALEIARRLAGLGELPAKALPPVAGELRTARVAVVGAGPAGLAAALNAGDGVLLVEREARPGGAALLGVDPASPDPDRIAEMARALRGELFFGALCVGLYANDTALPGSALLAVRSGARLVGVVAERVVIATGGASQPLPFPGGDRPGVYAARGLLGLPMRVGERLVVVGDGQELIDCARALRRKGYVLERVVAIGPGRPDAPDLPLQEAQPSRALGNPVRALEILAAGGGPPPSGGVAGGTRARSGSGSGGRQVPSKDERVRCDAVAIALPPAPLHNLATCAGAHARWVPSLHGFPLQVDADGRTSVPWLFAAGRAAGLGGAGAVPSGEAAGRACR